MIDLTERAFKSVARHFVSLSCMQHVPRLGELKTLVFSGFLIDVEGVWVYVTAGHIIRDIRRALDAGYTFDRWRFDDQSAGNSFNGMAVPMHFDIDRWLVIENAETGLDYAATLVDGLIREALDRGGALPLGKAAWGNQLTPRDHLALVGVPSETVSYDGGARISARLMFVPLEPADEPEAAGQKVHNQFYARLKADPSNCLGDVDGMSGGPVFAFRTDNEHGHCKYHVVGIQSAWYPSARTIAACPFSSFALELEKVIREALAVSSSQRA